MFSPVRFRFQWLLRYGSGMYSKKSALRGTGCTSTSTTRTATWVWSEEVRSWVVTAMSSTSLGRHRGRQAEAVEPVGVLPENLLPLFVGEIAGNRADLGHVPVRV